MATATRGIFRFNILLVIATLLVITLGGRTFSEVLRSNHWLTEHPECSIAKMHATQPDAKWQWAQTWRGDCAFFRDPDSGLWLVIVVIITGNGARAVLRLVTGFFIQDAPKDYLGRINRQQKT